MIGGRRPARPAAGLRNHFVGASEKDRGNVEAASEICLVLRFGWPATSSLALQNKSLAPQNKNGTWAAAKIACVTLLEPAIRGPTDADGKRDEWAGNAAAAGTGLR